MLIFSVNTTVIGERQIYRFQQRSFRRRDSPSQRREEAVRRSVGTDKGRDATLRHHERS